MILIVGLGNPGHEYEGSRHNMGFEVIDKFAEDKLGVSIDKKGFKGLYNKVNYRGQQVVLLKPQTYMNLSGQSVVEIVNFFKIKIEDIIENNTAIAVEIIVNEAKSIDLNSFTLTIVAPRTSLWIFQEVHR